MDSIWRGTSNMGEVAEKLDKAFNILAEIHVSKDDVERMAMAKQYLRESFKLIKETKDKETKKS